MRTSRVVVAGVVLLLGAGVAWWWTSRPAPDPAAPQSPSSHVGLDAHFGPERSKEVTYDGATYSFREKDYDEAVVLEAVPRTEAAMSTPEDAAQSLYSAAHAGDYEWWISLWDEKSRAATEANAERIGMTPEKWKDAWSAFHRGRMELFRRIDFDNFVVIYTRHVEPGETPAEADQQPTVYRRDEGQWLLTQELSSHPVFVFGDGHRPDLAPVREVTQEAAQ